MIDNFDLIESFLQFESEDDFYNVELLRRKKENPTLNCDVVVKDWIVGSIEYLHNLKADMISLSTYFNGRLVIRLNKRSFKNCAFKTINLINDCFMNDGIPHTGKLLAKAMGQIHNEPKTKWLLDVDNYLFDTEYVSELCNFVNNTIQPVGKKVIGVIPSKTGCHLLTYGFNPMEFHKKYPDIVINKDGPTNLYIPN